MKKKLTKKCEDCGKDFEVMLCHYDRKKKCNDCQRIKTNAYQAKNAKKHRDIKRDAKIKKLNNK